MSACNGLLKHQRLAAWQDCRLAAARMRVLLYMCVALASVHDGA